MKDLFVFVRPPRPAWPFNGPGSAFWPPLAFASMAEALRQSLPNLEVKIIDAPILKMGWKTLSDEIHRIRPTYVGLGEEAVSCVEGLRLARIAKGAGAKVVAGGCFFGNVAEEVLSTGIVDVVVHGEGEQTVVEMVRAMRDCGMEGLGDVLGISFQTTQGVVFTGHRAPLQDLDNLPMPAWDLLPMHLYGGSSRNHRAFTSIEFSRGCTHACSFCVLWRQMGQLRDTGVIPKFRQKSPERGLDEIKLLTNRWGRRYLCWVDPCFNTSSTGPWALADLLLRNDIRIGQSAWVRADYLMRDTKSGALDALTAAGLNEVYLGIERLSRSDLKSMGKQGSPLEIETVLDILATRYPTICTVGSFVYGIPGDTPSEVRRLVRAATALPLDIMFFIPMTPLPGTAGWRRSDWDASGHAFRRFNFLPDPNGNYSELTFALMRQAAFGWTTERLAHLLHGLITAPARRRSITRRHLSRSLPFMLKVLISSMLLGRNDTVIPKPAWYEN